jgi:PPOX class probable F420-dependent enzyme
MGALTMTKQEREEFLAGTHVGVLAVDGDGDGAAPVVMPIWYSYEPGGDVVVTTDATASKTVALRRAGQASLCVQTEAAPYQYVVVQGPVAISDGVDSAWRSGVAHRYLGEFGDAYIESTMDSEKTAVTVRLTPEKWQTTDYSKLF